MRALHARGRGRGARPALSGLDLSVPVGARLLLLSSPEGAGSVLVRVLAGLTRPSRGRISLAGVRRADETPAGWARRVAFVGPDAGIYPWLSPVEVLRLAARLAGLDRTETRRRVDEALERFGLGPVASRSISRGGAAVGQKVALAAALLGDPEVLLMNEPLGSVEPAQRQRLLAIPGRRVTMLIASRYPAGEVGIVDQVALIRDGRLALHASVNDLAAAALPLSLRGVAELAARGRAPAEAVPAR